MCNETLRLWRKHHAVLSFLVRLHTLRKSIHSKVATSNSIVQTSYHNNFIQTGISSLSEINRKNTVGTVLCITTTPPTTNIQQRFITSETSSLDFFLRISFSPENLHKKCFFCKRDLYCHATVFTMYNPVSLKPGSITGFCPF